MPAAVNVLLVAAIEGQRRRRRLTDGAFEEAGADVRFLPAAPPTPERMTTLLAQVHKAVAAVAEDDLDMDPGLAACVQLGLQGPHPVPPPGPAARSPLTVSASGMQLHAATTVDGRDRKQQGRFCRYMLRPPFAHDAVKALPDGRVHVLFKAAWRSGAAHAGSCSTASSDLVLTAPARLVRRLGSALALRLIAPARRARIRATSGSVSSCFPPPPSLRGK